LGGIFRGKETGVYGKDGDTFRDVVKKGGEEQVFVNVYVLEEEV
jgi:hypothetical protein